MHLRVGVHALFCRLYAMYPKNFLNYLQDQYMSRHAHMVETQEAIQVFVYLLCLDTTVIFMKFILLALSAGLSIYVSDFFYKFLILFEKIGIMRLIQQVMS